MSDNFVSSDLFVALADANATSGVVEDERSAIRAGHCLGDDAVFSKERDKEGEWRDQMGSIREKTLAFMEVFVDQAKLSLLEITQAPMDHFGRF